MPATCLGSLSTNFRRPHSVNSRVPATRFNGPQDVLLEVPAVCFRSSLWRVSWSRRTVLHSEHQGPTPRTSRVPLKRSREITVKSPKFREKGQPGVLRGTSRITFFVYPLPGCMGWLLSSSHCEPSGGRVSEYIRRRRFPKEISVVGLRIRKRKWK